MDSKQDSKRDKEDRIIMAILNTKSKMKKKEMTKIEQVKTSYLENIKRAGVLNQMRKQMCLRLV